MDVTEKVDFIAGYDPEGAERLKRLLGKQDALKQGNVYGERFTDRQFGLVFTPLLDAAYDRARILQMLGDREETVGAISEHLGMSREAVFGYMKEMIKKNLVEIGTHHDREAAFRRKA
jgi:hypothetical protein